MRKLSEDFPLIVGYLFALLIFFAFVGASMALFYRTTFAPYLYVLISLYLTSNLSETRRNDFLEICFGNERYLKLRILENMIIALPFVIFLIYKQQFYPTIFLVAVTVFLALSKFKISYNITIPTPFYKKPFEFTVGFRNTFFMFFIAYAFSIIAVTVDNFYLGIFALMLIFLTVSGYYIKPENEYFVWSYSLTPAKFLIEKIKTAFLFTFYLSFPVLLLLGIFNFENHDAMLEITYLGSYAYYFENIAALLLVTFIGYLLLATVIFAKYSAYPHEIGLLEAMMTIFCIMFPPMLIVVIPFFAGKSINKLKFFLR